MSEEPISLSDMNDLLLQLSIISAGLLLLRRRRDIHRRETLRPGSRLSPLPLWRGMLTLITVSGLFAQTPDASLSTTRARSAPVFTLYFENDIFSGTDEHYTNGVKLSWLSSDLGGWGQTGWRQRFVEMLPFVNRPEGQKNFGLAFGQNIYTPRNIETP